MKRSAVIFALGASLGGSAGVTASRELTGIGFVRFQLELPDGGTRELGRTGCYDFSQVKATVEACDR